MMKTAGAQHLLVLSTFPRKKEAEKVAKLLIRKRLAACCNLLPNLTSFFMWQGKREHSKELLLLIKTESRLFKEVSSFLRTHHPYEVPEIIALPITGGDHSYLTWIHDSCRSL